MKKERSLYITALVIFRSLVPSRAENFSPGPAETMAGPPGYLSIPPEEIARFLADLGRALGKEGKLAFFFPGCRALAAPFVLFRLKREGYSNCRAAATPEGLLVEATR